MIILKSLLVKDLILIDSATLEFGECLNIITGETGSGKSILIKAIKLVCGMKGDPDWVKVGKEQATIAADFLIEKNHPVLKLLPGLGIDYEIQEGKTNLLLRRNISNKGKSSCFVNDVPLTITALRELAKNLIEVVGQHDNLRLLDEDSHLAILDDFSNNQSELSLYQEHFQKLQTSLKDLQRLVRDYESCAEKHDYVLFRLKELADFAPSESEFLELKTFCQDAYERATSQKLLSQMQEIIDPYESENDFKYKLKQFRSYAQKLNNASQEKLLQLADSTINSLEEIGFLLSKNLNSLEFDNDSFEEKQQRLAKYQSLMRKLNCATPKDLEEKLQEAKKEVAFIEKAPEFFEKILYHAAEQSKKISELALGLSQKRRKAAKRLETLVANEFSNLHMAEGKIRIDFLKITKKSQISLPKNLSADLNCKALKNLADLDLFAQGHGEKGQEEVRFMIATNPTVEFRPFHKVVSGGELSRIMLATHALFATNKDKKIFVFDEVDTGISGQVADKVGQKLKQMSCDNQILCISHLAQVAAYGTRHFLVEKKIENKEATVQSKSLHAEQRVQELARLLSGAKITQTSIANARSLLMGMQS